MEYWSGAVPPDAVAVILPLLNPQAACTMAAVSTWGPFTLETNTVFVAIQPLKSFTVTVYVPAGKPEKTLPAW